MAGRTRLPRMSSLRPVLWPAGGLLLALLLAGCGSATKSGYRFEWSVFFKSIFQPDGLIIAGLWLTVSISIVSQIIGIILGVFGALGKMAKFAPFRIVANLYIWLFRGTPLLVQMMILYFGIPIIGLYSWPTINILGLSIGSEVQAGVFALGVNEGAYMSEIVRAGILAIDPGQAEAGKALGMTYGKIMRRIVLPQAARVIVPPLGNEFNNMLKTTSLLVVLSVAELFVTFSRKNGTVFKPFELFLACAVWYLLLTTIWGVIQAYIERRLGKSTVGASARPSWRARLFGRSTVPSEDIPLVTGSR
jgi:polar amino acid transport system permease protein